MASPVFRTSGKTLKTKCLKKKQYNPPKPHQCQVMYFTTKEELGTNVNPLAVAWDDMHGWSLIQHTYDSEYNVIGRPYSWKGKVWQHLTTCPFCGDNLQTANEVTIT